MKPAVLQVPIGAEAGFRGVVDVLTGQGVRLPGRLGDDEGGGRARRAGRRGRARARAAGRDHRRGQRRAAREVPRGTASCRPRSCAAGLREGTRAGKFLPVLCGAGAKGIGLASAPRRRSSTCCRRRPTCPPWTGDDPQDGRARSSGAADPAAPFSAFVFKTIVDPVRRASSRCCASCRGQARGDLTVVNTYRDGRERLGHLLQLEGKKQAQVPSRGRGRHRRAREAQGHALGRHAVRREAADRLPAAARRAGRDLLRARGRRARPTTRRSCRRLHRLMEEDTALRVHRDEQTKEFVISGTGQLHVEVAVERLKRKFGVEVELKAPKVPYKETIKGAPRRRASTRSRPAATGSSATAASSCRRCRAAAASSSRTTIVGGVDPAPVHPRGREGRARAAAAGHPRRLPDRRRQGEALRRLGTTTSTRRRWRSRSPRRLGFKKAFEQCRPVLLEPIMTITRDGARTTTSATSSAT